MSRYCPKCGADSYVIESRTPNQNVRRRRECERCGYRWTTIEVDRDKYKRIAKTVVKLKELKGVMRENQT